METQIIGTLDKMAFLNGLNRQELVQVASLCTKYSYPKGEICQTEGQPSDRIDLIVKGKVGVVNRITSIYSSAEIITDIFTDGEVFGWSALLHGAPWSTLRAVEPTEVLHIKVHDLVNLCETNHDIGYILMRNLASLISSRYRRNRMKLLNTIVSLKSE